MSYVSKTQMMKIVLTGTIGSGKTYVAKKLEAQGVAVLYLDAVAATIRDTIAKQAVIDAFGTSILKDDNIDRQALGALVFKDLQAKRTLENIIHPLVLEEMLAFFKTHEHEKLCVVEVANVHEFGWQKYFDEVWMVVCDHDVAINRLMKQRGYLQEYANTVLNAQKQFVLKDNEVQAYIYNNPEDDVNTQLQQLLERVGVYGITRR